MPDFTAHRDPASPSPAPMRAAPGTGRPAERIARRGCIWRTGSTFAPSGRPGPSAEIRQDPDMAVGVEVRVLSKRVERAPHAKASFSKSQQYRHC